MSLRSLEYAVAESLTAIRRNVLMSIASIVTVALSLGLLGGFVLFALGLNNLTQTQIKRFEIHVFLEKNTPEAQVLAINSKLQKLPNVQSVELVRAAAGWEKFKAEMGKEIDLSSVSGNPIGDSFHVKLKDPRFTSATATAIRGMSHVDEVNEGQHIVEQVVHFSDLVKLSGAAIALLLFLVTAFIVSNTIRLMIYSKRREIRIMQLVGATNWFIRLPLIFEGTLLGAIGGAVAYLLVGCSAIYLSRWVTATLGPLNPLSHLSSNIDPLLSLGTLIGLGWIIGAVGSLISIQRFLKA